MECADNPALHHAPEAFDGVGMNSACNVLTAPVVNRAVREVAADTGIGAVIVRGDQADSIGNRFADEGGQRIGIGMFYHTRDNAALALNSADDGGLAMSASAASTTRTAGAATVVLVPVLGFAADVGFIHFHKAGEFAESGVGKTSTDAVAHVPRSPVGAGSDQPMDLQGANTLLAGEHEQDDLEPCQQGVVGVLENRPNQQREAITLRSALLALPVPRLGLQFVHRLITAARAGNTLSTPAAVKKVLAAGVLVWEELVELAEGHLFCGHGAYLLVQPHCKASKAYCQVVHNRLN